MRETSSSHVLVDDDETANPSLGRIKRKASIRSVHNIRIIQHLSPSCRLARKKKVEGKLPYPLSHCLLG
jgi:hypothetical protein